MRTLHLALLCSLLVPAAPAWSQASEEVARRLISEGVEAARSRDWITARDRFQRAYEIQPLPLTLYNLGTAQEKTGLLVEADRAYRIFLKETVAGELDRFRQAAIEARTGLRARIAYLVLKSPNLAPGDVVRVDQRELARAVLGEALPSNPGTYTLTVTPRRRRGAHAADHAGRGRVQGGGARRAPARPWPAAQRPPRPRRHPPPAPRTTRRSPPPHRPPSPVTTTAGCSSRLCSGWWWPASRWLARGVGTYFAVRPGEAFDSSLEAITVRGR
jgi:hypothetical protein